MTETYEIRNLCKTYNGGAIVANDQVCLSIRDGDIFGILGGNGAGKTTLVKQLVGLIRPSSGEISFQGRPLDDALSSIRSTVSFMPQSSDALNRMTVVEALTTTSLLKGRSRTEASTEARTLIADWGLETRANQQIVRLSGGEKRLAQIATTLTGDFPVLLLDEPTNDLDPHRRKLVWDNLRQLNEEKGKTIIFITHDAKEAEKIVQTVAVMSEGRVVAHGKTDDLLRPLRGRFRVSATIPITSRPVLEANLVTRPLFRDSSDGMTRLTVEIGEKMLASATEAISEANAFDLEINTMNLEDFYLQHAKE